MRVCFFGTYEKKIHSNRTIIEGLKKNNIEVIECHGSLVDNIDDKSNILSKNKFLFFLKLVKIYFRLIISQFKIKNYDIIIVGYVGQYDVFLAKFFSVILKKPLVFAPLVSLYDTFVEDREKFLKESFLAKIMYYMDKKSCKLADMIFLDTQTHAEYFSKEFNIPISKFRRVWVGTNENVFYPVQQLKNEQKKFTVVYYGKYIPLHGVEYILDAAKVLLSNESIHFLFVGIGQLYQNCENRIKSESIKNITLVSSFFSENELLNYIRDADICLGIFGITKKSARVIPNKVYDCIGMGKPVITRDSPAIKEIFTHEKNIFLCKEGSGEEIAKSIIFLKEHPEIREKIGEGAKKIFKENFSWDVIGKDIVIYLNELNTKKIMQ
ncbi:glycosyltransferase [Candidatus Desantisbacteria bacterium]|nr:glycosyltransferase [Candidatus Desantisbacteria bacterium]